MLPNLSSLPVGIPGDPPPYDEMTTEWEPGLDPPADAELTAHQAMTRATGLLKMLKELLADIEAGTVDGKGWQPLHSQVILAVDQVAAATDSMFRTWHGVSQKDQVLKYYNEAYMRLENDLISLSKTFDEWVNRNRHRLCHEPASAPAPQAPAPPPAPASVDDEELRREQQKAAAAAMAWEKDQLKAIQDAVAAGMPVPLPAPPPQQL